jgi:hypothetical protein
MDEFLLSLRRLPMIILAALLVIPTGCVALGEQSTSGSAVANVSPEATASLADPTLTATQPPVEIATATPTADLPIAPVTGARAPDFTLTDLNGSEVSLSGLRGRCR